VKRMQVIGFSMALIVLGAVGASAALKDGATPPMMHVKVLAGVDVGKAECFTCTRAMNPGALVFVTENNKDVAGLVKRLDGFIAQKGGHWGATVVFLGNAGKDQAAIKRLATSEHISHVSLAIVDLQSDVPQWDLGTAHPVNAYLVDHHKIEGYWGSAYPHCGQLVADIAKASSGLS
jgi:hypothetical protein